MLNNPMLMQMVAEEIYRDRQAAWLEEASIDRALKATRAPTRRLRERLLMSVGDLLISAGCKLHQHVRPPVYSDAHQSGCCKQYNRWHLRLL